MPYDNFASWGADFYPGWVTEAILGHTLSPGPTLDYQDLATLGGDVLSGTGGMVLTRLHAFYIHESRTSCRSCYYKKNPEAPNAAADDSGKKKSSKGCSTGGGSGLGFGLLLMALAFALRSGRVAVRRG